MTVSTVSAELGEYHSKFQALGGRTDRSFSTKVNSEVGVIMSSTRTVLLEIGVTMIVSVVEEGVLEFLS